LLSILVPTYNRAGYLRECLESLLATTVDCEVIVGDNASGDDTSRVVASFGDPRIRYHRHAENLGALANFNFLINAARGKYVCIFGDDDVALPGNFEPKVGLLEAHPDLALVYSKSGGMDEAGRGQLQTKDVYGRSPSSYLGGRDEFQELFVNCYISWQTMVFRRSLIDEIGDLADGWGLVASQDWYWLQKMVRGRQTAFIAEPMVMLRVHRESYSAREAMKKGQFGNDRMVIWRRWLLEDPDPPVVSNLLWERMVRVAMSDVKDMGDDPAHRDRVVKELATLKHAYVQRMDERMRFATGWSDPFHPGAEPWPLEGLGARSFAYFPQWIDEAWREVIRGFVAAFTAEDDATLVLVLDPRQGITADDATRLVLAELEASSAATPPDLLLVPEPSTAEDFARVIAAVGAVVAPHDPCQADRARRMGKPVLAALEPAAWLG
jgi:glycosyltransferase involved in cell wall biosynthesis